jgi:hypothetical protein
MCNWENMCGVEKPQLYAAHGASVPVGSKHSVAEIDLPKRAPRGNDRVTARFGDLFVDLVVVHTFGVLANFAQHLDLLGHLTTFVQVFKVLDVGSQEVGPEGDGKFAVFFVMRRETVDGRLIKRDLAKLDRGRRAKDAAVTSEVKASENADVVPPAKN